MAPSAGPQLAPRQVQSRTFRIPRGSRSFPGTPSAPDAPIHLRVSLGELAVASGDSRASSCENSPPHVDEGSSPICQDLQGQGAKLLVAERVLSDDIPCEVPDETFSPTVAGLRSSRRATTNGEATRRVLEGSRLQRIRQEALLQQADQHLTSYAREVYDNVWKRPSRFGGRFHSFPHSETKAVSSTSDPCKATTSTEPDTDAERPVARRRVRDTPCSLRTLSPKTTVVQSLRARANTVDLSTPTRQKFDAKATAKKGEEIKRADKGSPLKGCEARAMSERWSFGSDGKHERSRSYDAAECSSTPTPDAWSHPLVMQSVTTSLPRAFRTRTGPPVSPSRAREARKSVPWQSCAEGHRKDFSPLARSLDGRKQRIGELAEGGGSNKHPINTGFAWVNMHTSNAGCSDSAGCGGLRAETPEKRGRGPVGSESPSPRLEASSPSRHTVSKLASEYLAVCGRYEDHLNELKMMCGVLSRTVDGPSLVRSHNIAVPARNRVAQYPSKVARSCVNGAPGSGTPVHSSTSGSRLSWPASSPQRSPRPNIKAPLVEGAVPVVEEFVIEALLKSGVLSAAPHVEGDETDLHHIRSLFAAQLPRVPVIGVYRIENSALTGVYCAVRDAMEVPDERELWHGTSADCVTNIVRNGFNRAYSGRHGTKLGHGTYFSAAAGYSMRFCDRKRSRRVMFLAKVLTGAKAKGSPELVEPPQRDAKHMTRYDSTVDDVFSPSTFCIFRDFQALPCYLIEFESSVS
mmetsp:Transcript_51126/g.136476  ORF Transcript_51126/g.136476 Transcript_51126/m.136476 type:complete len:747 (-) Transcript_51126:89-2329(-)